MENEKAIGLFRLRLNSIMAPFNLYGLDVWIPPAIENILREALLLHTRLNEEMKSEVGSQPS